MRATDLLAELPKTSTPEREERIFQAVVARDIHVEWTLLTIEAAGHQLELFVGCNALAVGDADDHVRVAVWASTMQLICDELNCIMPTARLSDAIYNQALRKLPPLTQTPDSHMSDTARFVKHSQAIDEMTVGFQGLVAPEGKDFVLCNALWLKPGYAANYGWQTPGGKYAGVTPGVRLWQPLAEKIDPRTKKPALPHIVNFTDYSQLVRLVSREATLDGEPVDLADVYQDLELSALVSHEGPLKGWRYPTVPEGSKPWGEATKIQVPEFSPIEPTLRHGDRDDEPGGWVERWQLELIERGFDMGPAGADGWFWNTTLKQTKAYQRSRYDIPLAVDGVVGPACWASVDTPSPEPKNDLEAADEPPAPDFPPIVGLQARQAMWGVFQYRELAEPKGAIQILGNWRKNNIIWVEVPQLVGVKGFPRSGKIEIHKKVAPQFLAFWREVQKRGKLPLVHTFDGLFVPRLTRGRKSLSNHSFGTAFDLNYQWNRMGSEGADYGEHGSIRELLPIAYEFGFFNGLFFKGRPDPTHFEAAKIVNV